jgi:tetratricopeptide (TPR) repeat protein
MSSEPKVVSIGGSRRPDPARVREFAATARKLQHEREASGDAVARLLRKPLPPAWEGTTDDPELLTTGAVDRIILEAAEQIERDPQRACRLAELATSLAEALGDEDYPPVITAQIRAHAWKTRAQALLYRGAVDESLRAIETAEKLVQPFGTLTHDRAVVRLTRALILQHLGRFDDSVALIANARRVFFDHRDLKRCVDAGMSEGILLYRMRRFESARDTFGDLLEVARELGNREQLARLHNNLGHCCVSLDDLDTATTHLGRAAELFTELGLHVEALRTELSAAELAVRRKDCEPALARLSSIRTRFASHGLYEEAGFCAIEMVELFVRLGRVREAIALACTIDDFSRTAYRDGAQQALAHLQRHLDGGAPLDVIAYVRSLLRSLAGQS